MLAGAVGTAVKLTVSHFHAMPNDHAAAMGASGRQGMDGTFEAVEYVPRIAKYHGKRLVILISTDFTPGHLSSFLQFQPIK
jgi:hypothetical protein